MGVGHGIPFCFKREANRCSFGNPRAMSSTYMTRYHLPDPAGTWTQSLLLMGTQNPSRMSVFGGSRRVGMMIEESEGFEYCGVDMFGARSWHGTSTRRFCSMLMVAAS